MEPRLNTVSLGSRPTSLPSGILIHPAIWSQQVWAANWGLCPFGEGPGAGSRSDTTLQTGQTDRTTVRRANRFTNGRPKT